MTGGEDHPPPLGRRERNKREKRRRLLEAARMLFTTQGFQQTTTRQISREAGVATGTLFTYFEDKQQLLRSLFLEDIDMLTGETFAQLDASAPIANQLMTVFETLFRYYGRDLELGKHIFQAFAFRSEIDPITQRFIRRLIGVFESGKRDGRVRVDLATPTAAYCAFALYINGVMVLLQGVMPQATHRAMVRGSLDVLIEGMRPYPSA